MKKNHYVETDVYKDMRNKEKYNSNNRRFSILMTERCEKNNKTNQIKMKMNV